MSAKPGTSRRILEALIEAGDYRAFLQDAFAIQREENPRFSFGAFSRRAGFSARSYPREVLIGSRRLTLRTVEPFARALGLTGDAAAYFRLLVGETEPELRGPAARPNQKDRLRAKILARLETREPAGSRAMYRSLQWPYVYAALGEVGGGATESEIAGRTLLPPDRLRAILGDMHEAGLVRRQGERWIASAFHVRQDGLGGSAYFQRFFLQTWQRIGAAARREFASPRHLFHNSVFSIRAERLGELKARLLQTMQEISEEAEDPNGDRLVTLVLGAELLTGL